MGLNKILVPVYDKTTPNKEMLGQASQTILPAGLPDYKYEDRKAGDIFFHYKENVMIGHVNMVASNVYCKLDAVLDKKGGAGGGIRYIDMIMDDNTSIVFRFHDPEVALSAAKLAESWSLYSKVGYSSFGAGGITKRGLGLLFGPCNFGKGAQGRLLKYRSRPDLAPSNVTCPEMCLLAYQLNLLESSADFPKLDAKFASPPTLFKYFVQNPQYWKPVGIRRNGD